MPLSEIKLVICVCFGNHSMLFSSTQPSTKLIKSSSHKNVKSLQTLCQELNLSIDLVIFNCKAGLNVIYTTSATYQIILYEKEYIINHYSPPTSIGIRAFQEGIPAVTKILEQEARRNGTVLQCGMVGEDRGIPFDYVYPYTVEKLKNFVNFSLDEQQYNEIMASVGPRYTTWELSKSNCPDRVILSISSIGDSSFSVRMCTLSPVKSCIERINK